MSLSVYVEVELPPVMIRGKRGGRKPEKCEPIMLGASRLTEDVSWEGCIDVIADLVQMQRESIDTNALRWTLLTRSGKKGGILPVTGPDTYSAMITRIKALPGDAQATSSIVFIIPEPQKKKVVDLVRRLYV